ncbi:MAG: two-component regulator propeller domain-containing protein [Bacteroidota bacterium]
MRAGTVSLMSRFTPVLVLFCCWIFFSADAAAGIGTWKNYTAMKSVRAVSSDGHSLWVATSGGVFRFDPSDSSYQKIVNSDGLSSNNVTAIAADTTGIIWIGHQSGAIDAYDSKHGTWKYITDVSLSGKTNKSINGFTRSGDKLYIATAFGIAVFSVTKFEFSDTYTGFGGAVQPKVISIALFQNKLFAITNAGIISSKSGAVNLAAPESWEILSLDVTGNGLLQFNNGLYASTGSGLMKYQSNAWINVGIGGATRMIASLDTALLFTEFGQVKSINTSGGVSILSPFIPYVVTCTAELNKTAYLGFENNGIGSVKNGIWQSYFPNSPYSNSFYQLTVDENGVLWSATGQSNGGNGFYSFNGTTWRNYNTTNTPLLRTNDCFGVTVGPNNSKWVSTWGEGLLLLNSAGDVVKRYDYSTGIIGLIRNDGSGLPSYVLPSRPVTDRFGNVWFSSFLSVNTDKVVWKIRPDSTMESFVGSPYGKYGSGMMGTLIDQNQTKWFINTVHGRVPDDAVLVFFNESKALPGAASSGWGTITLDDGLTNTQTETMAFDKDGDLWIGTAAGISIITDVSNPKSRITKVFLGAVRDQLINCIAVDPLNNKWVATSTGVFILSPDGTQLLQQYNVELSGGKMLDDNVLSIAFDTKKGIAYFGTEKGLSSVEITAVAAKNSFSSIDLSPNPVYLPNHSTVEIRGLVDESTVKVLALNGKVIKQFPAQGGGRAFWDCRDGEGRMVASGIYIIVAHNRAGDQIASAKVAVIRK